MATQRIAFSSQRSSKSLSLLRGPPSSTANSPCLSSHFRPLLATPHGAATWSVPSTNLATSTSVSSAPPPPLGSSDLDQQQRTKSTHAITPYNTEEVFTAVDGYVVTAKGYKKKVDILDLSFADHRAAFKSKSTWDIIRALVVFNLCSVRPLVEHNAKTGIGPLELMKIGQTIMGKKLFGQLMKGTFYGQFVAGEDQERIKPVIRHMHSYGVKSILDYSVEEDISDEKAQEKELKGAVPEKETLEDFKDLENKGTYEDQIKRYKPHRSAVSNRKYKVSGARTYFYEGEASCEKNMETFLRCIEAVADSTHGTGFSAIKVTALGRPSLLLQLSEVIVRARRFYQNVSGHDGFVIEGKVSKEAFEQRFKQKVNYDKYEPEVQDWLGNMTFDKKGLIHMFSWSGLIDSQLLLKDVFRVPNLKTGHMVSLMDALTDEEEEQFRNMLNRIQTVFQAAKDLDVRVMVDAEQTYFQPAIHRLTMEMQKKFNTEKAIVFNTYQCYLKIAYHSLVLDLEQAQRQNFYFGAKLVRGAYMEQERGRAKQLGYEDPINPTYEATSDMYHRCLNECMRRMSELKQLGDGSEQRIGIMVASHNGDTIRYAIQRMEELGIKPEDRLICFGQLLGMCDNISFPLGQAGYSVYKYVPYGPVNEVLPYLSRRAQENQGMLSKLKVEKKLMMKELLRRTMRLQLLGKPQGDYVPVGFEDVKVK
ncbi:proline dehydrogenase 1, mitochondrial-like isoform X3 [Tigriopus californicus]|uniref:proline dehydrogenase 1, mitochondrial-like isoform X3 n=1 Tax=Tigriopus californicus TaxID=6832 RepID=UPI0027DA6A88|nr:proline dehydrogenase 1, mitochondrial-like isoform X3 [Tigriopus californicus]